MQWALIIEYDGTHYAGFQIQNNARTVQEELERSLTVFFGEPIRIHFAGRTDSGVHASGQVISFSPKKKDILPSKLASSLNGILPRDIAVRGITRVQADFHPRYSCTAREYEYLIWNHPLRAALWEKKALWIRQSLPLDKLNKELEAILGTHDFSAFTPKNTEHKNPVRHVYRAKFIQNQERDDGLVRFQICANAFLRNMIRILLGSLVDISFGRLSYSLKEILESRERIKAGSTIAPTGLYLRNAYYPPEYEIKEETEQESDSKDTCLSVMDPAHSG